MREASRARRMGRALAVLVVDLDGLKHVNDHQGHAAGDDLLRHTAEVLRQHRVTDTACRLGGDEFGLLALVRDEPDADVVSARLRAELAAAGVSVSVGAAVAAGDLSTDALLELWREADEQMYRDKRT